MQTFHTYTARELRNLSGELLKGAERGELGLITKYGKPAILAIPFDDSLLQHGVHRALALNLFKSRQLTLAQAAKIAGMSLEEFMQLLAEAGIDAVDYPAEELDRELEVV